MGRPHIPSATGGDGSPMTVRWRDNVQRYWGVKSALEVCATSRHGVGMCTRGELIHTIATMRRDTHGCRVMGDISKPGVVLCVCVLRACAHTVQHVCCAWRLERAACACVMVS